MSSGWVSYPFQLRPGVWITVRLPADFTSADVRRIAATLETMTVDQAVAS